MSSSSRKRDLLITQIPLVKLPNRKKWCRTVLYHSQGETCFGDEAVVNASQSDDIEHLVRDFKVSLGFSTRKQRHYVCGDGKERAPRDLTREFLSELFPHVCDALAAEQITDASHIIVAAPVNPVASETRKWLTNYRKTFRDILRDKGIGGSATIRFPTVEFLPEPFAVFNFYRYGYRHPAVVGHEKYRALVIDSGGGTTDCSVVETTSTGDVRAGGGKNSSPLGARSDTAGGYWLDHCLAARLIRESTRDPKVVSRLDSALAKSLRVVYGEIKRTSLNAEQRIFHNNYLWAVEAVDRAKCRLSRRIDEMRAWSDPDIDIKETVTMSVDPFAEDRREGRVILSSRMLREVFRKQLWEERLVPLISKTLTGAFRRMDDPTINRIILSGGTSNLRWLNEWIREIPHLEEARIVDVTENFQGIVAQGLAIECARRFFTEDNRSDFQSVIYNPLSITLAIGDEQHARPRVLIPEHPSLNRKPAPGVLLEASTDLSPLIGQELVWRVEGEHPPPDKIKYFVYSAKVEDLPDGKLSYEEYLIESDEETGRKGELRLALIIDAGGTASLRFFVGGDGRNRGKVLHCKPFEIDMTDSEVPGSPLSSYIGLDFGSSNTSVSLVSSKAISTYERMQKEGSWIELNDLPDRLPKPIADLYSLYLANSRNPVSIAKWARACIESSLAIMIPMIRNEQWRHLETSNKGTPLNILKLFKFQKVSSGPLFTAIEQHTKNREAREDFCRPIYEMINGEQRKLIEDAVQAVAAVKHDKVDERTVRWNQALLALGNCLARIFDECEYGVFFDLSFQAGRSSGFFRPLLGDGHGQLPREVFLNGPVDTNQPYMICKNSSRLIPLFPWLLIETERDTDTRNHLFFDGGIKGRSRAVTRYSFKAPGSDPKEMVVQKDGKNPLDVYFDEITGLLNGEYDEQFVRILS